MRKLLLAVLMVVLAIVAQGCTSDSPSEQVADIVGNIEYGTLTVKISDAQGCTKGPEEVDLDDVFLFGKMAPGESKSEQVKEGDHFVTAYYDSVIVPRVDERVTIRSYQETVVTFGCIAYGKGGGTATI